MANLSYLQRVDASRFAIGEHHSVMKAVVTTGSGGYEQLDYCDVPIPKPRPGEVLLKVLAAGMNNTEINTRLGWYSSSIQASTEQSSALTDKPTIKDGGWNDSTPFPFIQGTDCCGEVVAVGEKTQAPAIGQRVLVRACMRIDGFDSLTTLWMGSDFDGAFAQYVTVPASEVFAVKCHWRDDELASIPCAYGTAENMLHRANVNRNDCLLVTGASGGVGSAVVQLAKRRGATVIAITSEAKLATVKNLGADEVIPRDADLASIIQPGSVNVVVDNVAGKPVGAIIKLIARGGRYVSSGAIAGPITTIDMRDVYLNDITIIGCTAWDEPVFPNLIRYIEDNEIRPLVAKTFALKDIAIAQQEFLQKTHFGNFVLIPSQ